MLDNSQGNFASWREALFEQVSQLKYGEHATCLITSTPAPIFRPCPGIDDVTTHGTYEYQHMDVPAADPEAADPEAEPILSTLLIGIPGRLTICGQTFHRQDIATHTAENNKFKTQGLELFEFIISKVSPSSKLLDKTQPGYLQAMQTNCPHQYMMGRWPLHTRQAAPRGHLPPSPIFCQSDRMANPILLLSTRSTTRLITSSRVGNRRFIQAI